MGNFSKIIPKKLVVRIPSIYLFKNTEYDIDAKVLFKYKDVKDNYLDYLDLIKTFSSSNSIEYEKRRKALEYARVYFDHGGSCESFFSFQLIYLWILQSESNEEELKKNFNLTPEEFREFAINAFFVKIGMKRTKELEDSLVGFSSIKLQSLIEFIIKVKNEV